MQILTRATLAVSLAILVACSDSSDSRPPAPPPEPPQPPVEEPTYEATVTRTEYGVPHIVADDWGSLGFGLGHAVSGDHGCIIADQVLRARSERALFLGPGDDGEDRRQVGMPARAAPRHHRAPRRRARFRG